jgi:hypothetical protein
MNFWPSFNSTKVWVAVGNNSTTSTGSHHFAASLAPDLRLHRPDSPGGDMKKKRNKRDHIDN